MKFFENKLNYFVETPNEKYRNDIQEYLNREWDNTTLLADVEEETEIGSFEFKPIEVHKSTVSEFTINGVKNPKDYRQLLFRECDIEKPRGLFYRFDKNYWIVYNPTQSEEPYNSIYVRRCNNIAKWIDKDTGRLIEQPCVFGDEVSSFMPRVTGNYVNNASNNIILWLQGNKDTLKLKENMRLIFNRRPFKVVGYNNSLQNDYVTKETPILFFDLKLDEISPNDDLENNIANRYDYDYNITISGNPKEQVVGYEGKFNVNITLNNKVVDLPVKFSCDKNGTIDEYGNYKLTGKAGEQAVFVIECGLQRIEQSITIKSETIDNYELIVTPIISELKQGCSVNFEANLYKNGIKTSSKTNAVVKGATNCYNFVDNLDNTFSLKCLKPSNELLSITFKNDIYTKELNIKLKSIL